METYTLTHLPPSYRRLSIAYFDNVENAAEIKKELVRSAQLEGPEGEEARRRMDFAFVEADVIVSRLHLLTAIQTALLTSLPQSPTSSSTTPSSPSSASASSSSTPTPTPTAAKSANGSGEETDSPPLKTRTHNIHSEILFALNTNNNISDALRSYSVSDKTKRLLVVRIGPDASSSSGPGEGASEKELYDHIASIVKGRLTSMDDLEGNVDWKRVDKLYKLAELNQALKGVNDETSSERKRAAVVGTVAVKPST